MATVEINDGVFCQEHLVEIFDPVDRDGLEVPPASVNDEGVYICDQHSSATCNQCFGWKKKITKARMDAKRAGRA
ncbi:hypothetical protein DER46DRAFT_667643 [Fusarium sp. MPI-SDFR-AT-0072]|nr:hypothetical protein DER46DRAFT_667643 [Fusarium sp. MPI-SDFR-AT-0072]